MDLISGRYQIQKELGVGGMGTVYLATDTKLGREVTLKMVHPHLLINENTQSRFKTEAKAVAALSHENIVSLYDVEEKDRPFLVMEFINGSTLGHLLERHAVLPNLILLEIGKQLLEGLAAAHEKGIVHRDIKPPNLLIDKRGCLKITDFGVARLLHQEVMTATGQFLGTPEYTSPEVITSGKITVQADIFSAGCLLYQCASGGSPFQGENLHHVMQQICDINPEAASEANPRLLSFTNDLIGQMMLKDPGKRPSAQHAAQAIDNFILESRIKQGKWRVMEYVSDTESYLEREDRELHAYFLRQAESRKRLGKEAGAHRSLYQAGLFGHESGIGESEPLRAAASRKKLAAFAAILLFVFATGGLVINKFYQSMLDKDHLRNA
ncbi:serine/threonine-protein kinase, partial [Fibrobacterota bacterium]